MFALFRLNDPYRMLVLLLFLLLMKLPAFYGSVPLTIPELNWMVVGEKLAEKGTVMYKDVWDPLAPLAAGMYWLLHELFGRSHLAYQIIALLLIFVQSALFNYILLRNKVYNENTYVPALIYGLLMCTFFQFYTLSPALVSTTFVMLTINNAFNDIEFKGAKNNLFSTGILMGLASLFYLPSLVLSLALLFAYLLFTGATPKSYFLFLYGLLMPWLIIIVYYFWHDALFHFYINCIYSLLYLDNVSYISYSLLITIIGLPLVILILSFFKLFDAKRFNNYQERFQQTMIFIFIMAFVAWWISHSRTPALLVLFVPVVAFFISHFFLLIRKRFITEISFLLFFIGILTIHFSTLFQWNSVAPWLDYEKLVVQETPWDDLVENKRILYLGDNLSVYKNAQLATPYLNWELSSLQLDSPDYYDNLMSIYENFHEDTPEVIIDTKDVMGKIFTRMPTIAKQYTQGNEAGVYIKE